MADPEISEEQLQAFRTLIADPRPFSIEMSKARAFYLLGLLQLTLRHPLLSGNARDTAVAIAASIEACIALDGPLREIIERGWNWAYDVAPESEKASQGT